MDPLLDLWLALRGTVGPRWYMLYCTSSSTGRVVRKAEQEMDKRNASEREEKDAGIGPSSSITYLVP